MLVIGICVSFIPPSVYSLPSELVPPGALPLAFGLLIFCQNLGVTIRPYLTGRVRDVTGSYAWSYLFIAGFLVLMPMLLAAVIPLRRAATGKAAP